MKLRVMTYNIRWGMGVDGKFSLERIAGVIRESGADLVGLQEVERGSPRSRFRDEPCVIARELGMHVAFGGNLRLGSWQFGNALLSRFPLQAWRNVPLPASRGPIDRPAVGAVGATHASPLRRSVSLFKLMRQWVPSLVDRRGVLVASLPLSALRSPLSVATTARACRPVEPPAATLTESGERRAESCLSVLVTHLPLSYQVRLAQARVILGLLRAAGGGPALLMGDFNEPPDAPTVTLFGTEGRLENVSGCEATFPSRHPTSKLDYILVSPGLYGLGEPRVIPSPASDHLPVVVDVALPA
jgi:endonuclease/exonuclease/phosphatase family metal-dependent hydrolase